VFCIAQCFTLSNNALFAQHRDPEEENTRIFSYWYKGLETAQNKLGVTTEDFTVFKRFEKKQVDSLLTNFLWGVRAGEIDSSTLLNKIADEETSLMSLYAKYEAIKKEFPSSIESVRTTAPISLTTTCDPSGCTNIGFEEGTLNGWNAYYAVNFNPETSPSPPTSTYNFFNYIDTTGGPAGAVTHAANDGYTSTTYYVAPGSNGTGTGGPNPNPDYQINITSGLRGDKLVPSVPVVSPYGGKYSVMIGDSTLANYGVAILSKTFYVTTANADFIYEYAVFLENPSHPYYAQPIFMVKLLDQHNHIIQSCGEYNVVSGNGTENYNSIQYNDRFYGAVQTVYYKNWTIVGVSLKKYIGTCVTIIFESADCGQGGHFGYAYVDAECAPLQILTSSPAICGKPVTLTGPPGFVEYYWSSTTGLSLKGDSLKQSIQTDSAGTYSLVVVPVTGKSCSDTLTITIPKAPGPPPIPSFTTDTTCTGRSTYFNNTSIPLGSPGAKFYWDFYNIGVFQDSTTNPSWSYNAPGTYSVKLYELNNGCGADTTIKVTITPPPASSIIAPATDCNGAPVTLTATGGGEYLWSTGATTSSIAISPVIPDSTYYVKVTKGCSDTAYTTIHLYPVTPVVACCDTGILLGNSAPLNATAPNGDTYLWSPTFSGCDYCIDTCYTCAHTKASPPVTTTYSVITTDVHGCKSEDSVKVTLLPCSQPTPSFVRDTNCLGKATVFTNTSTPGSGPGVKFYWDFYNHDIFNDSTANPSWTYTAPGIYTVKLYENAHGCGKFITGIIDVVPPPKDTIIASKTDCQGVPITLKAGGGGTYLWSTGATTKSITLSPTAADTAFYVKVTLGCSDTAYRHVRIFPVTPIVAYGDTTIQYGDSAIINTTNAFSYAWSPPTALSCDTCPRTIASPTLTTTYTVTGTNTFGCKTLDTVRIIVETCANAFIPNAFSPNNDRVNDVFAPRGDCILDYFMYIYDRWGVLLYKGNTPWDGTFNGKGLQEDTYVYKVIITTNNRAQRTYIGRVTLLR